MLDDSAQFFIFIIEFIDDVHKALPAALIKKDNLAKRKMKKGKTVRI